MYVTRERLYVHPVLLYFVFEKIYLKPRPWSLSCAYFLNAESFSFTSLFKNIKVKVYKTIILALLVCWCGSWSLTRREERRLRVFKNRVLKVIFGPKRDEVTGEWRKPHNEELSDLCCSPNIVRVIKSRMGLARSCSTYGREERWI
jgi:hypothetical protein